MSLLHVHVLHTYAYILFPCSAKEENRMTPLMLLVFMWTVCASVSYLCGRSCMYVCIYVSVYVYMYIYICVCTHACLCLLGIGAQPHSWLDLGNGAVPASPLSECWIQPDSPNRWKLVSVHDYICLCIKLLNLPVQMLAKACFVYNRRELPYFENWFQGYFSVTVFCRLNSHSTRMGKMPQIQDTLFVLEL